MYPAFAPHIVTRSIQLRSGVRLRIADAGPADGTPIVMLHGWGASLYMYRHALERFPKHGLRAIAVDLRGYGLSDKPKARDSYSLTTYCDDLGALLDALELPQAALVGQSMGGGLSLRYALGNPARVSRLVLINPSGLSPVPYLSLLQLSPASILNAIGRRLVPRWAIAAILRYLAYSDPSRVTERDVEEYWAPSQLDDGFVHAARAALSEFNWDVVTDSEALSLAVPALVVLGEKDRLLRTSNQAAARLNGSRVERVAGGHCAHEEHPDVVYEMVAEFVR